jgi:hypothetical protein
MPKNNKEITKDQIESAVLFSEISYYEHDSKEFKSLLEAMQNHSDIGKIKKAVPFRKTKSSNSNELAGFVFLTEENKLIIAYHGTSNLEEVKSDLYAVPTEFSLPRGGVMMAHAGMYDQFLQSNEDRINVMNKVEEGEKVKSRSYTGHSLGGALASFSAVYDKDKDSNIEISVITFGSPRPWHGESAKQYVYSGLSKHTVHIQQEYDPVPNLPLKPMGYKHVGHVIKLQVDEPKLSVHTYDNYKDIAYGSKIKGSLGNTMQNHVAGEFGVESYKKTVMNIDPVFLSAIMRKSTPLSLAAMALQVAVKIKNNNDKGGYKINPKLIIPVGGHLKF